MKICLAVVGLARSLDICLPSIEHKILRSFRMAPGLRVSESLILSHSAKPLNNERTGEDQAPTIDPQILGSRKATLLPLEQIREESSALFSRALRKGEWLEGSGRNLRNYLEFLTVLKKAGESLADEDADVVIFIRPDLLVLDKFIPVRGVNLSTTAILTPRWGRFFGLNDRMAIIPQRFIPEYFSRLDTVEEFIEEHGPLDPEKHLAWALREIPSRPSLTTELVRVRAGGVLAEKDLERLETSGPFRRAQARKLRRTYPAG